MTKKIKKENKLEELERRIKILEENSISKFELPPIAVPQQPYYLPYYPPQYNVPCAYCGRYDCPGIHVIC